MAMHVASLVGTPNQYIVFPDGGKQGTQGMIREKRFNAIVLYAALSFHQVNCYRSVV